MYPFMFLVKHGEGVGGLASRRGPQACGGASVSSTYVEPLFDDFGLIVPVGDLPNALQERGVYPRGHLDHPDP